MVHMKSVHTVAEDENIVGELNGHFDQALRTALSGGLQVSEQRARRRQHEAEAERILAKDVARQLEERRRAEIEANALLVQQRIATEETERAEQLRRTVDEAIKGTEGTASESETQSASSAYPSTIGEALARARQNASEHPAPDHTANARHQRERGAAKTTAELGR